MDILGRAVVVETGSHVVEVANHVGWPVAVQKTADVQLGAGVRLAQTTTAELARWLAMAINRTLDGQGIDGVRPSGKISSRGHFEVAGSQVLVWSWQGNMVTLAHCPTATSATDLAEALNALLNNP